MPVTPYLTMVLAAFAVFATALGTGWVVSGLADRKTS